MNFRRRSVTAIALALMAMPFLEATSSHTWVGGNGNDANAGTQTSPFATFQTAVNNTTAGGMVSVASAGDFGAFTISKAVTVDGGGIRGTITFTGGEGIFVTAGTSDFVVLRNLTVNGLGVGSDAIFINQASNVLIEDCRIENFSQIGIGLGSLSAVNVVVRNTTIVGGTLGVRTFQSSGLVNYDVVSMRNVSISGATNAAVFSRNGVMEISDSVITQSFIGLEADTGAYINVANSVISFNATDEQGFNGLGIIDVSNNNTLFSNNGQGGGGGPQLSAAIRPAITTPLPPDKPRPHHQ
jgi:hypothetical protein